MSEGECSTSTSKNVLKNKSRWITTDDKVPRCEWQNDKNWKSYQEAKEDTGGNGFVLSPEDDIVFIDLDDVVDDGEIVDWAQKLIDGCTGLVEKSISGTGVHIFTKADLDDTSYKLDHKNAKGQLEIYTQDRFALVTEDWIREDDLEDSTEQVEEVIEVFEAMNASRKDIKYTKDTDGLEVPEGEIDEALQYLDPECGYEEWRNIGFALADYYGDYQEAKKKFREWSKQADEKYDEKADMMIDRIIQDYYDQDRSEDERITIATLIYLAKQRGYTPDFGQNETRIRERDGRYYILDDDLEKEITSFTITVQSILRNNKDERLIRLEVDPADEFDDKYTTEMDVKSWNEPRDFRNEVCTGLTTNFRGNRNDLAELREYVLGSIRIEEKEATRKIGIHGDEFVGVEQTYRLDDENHTKEYVKNGSKIEQKWELELGGKIDEGEVRKALEKVTEIKQDKDVLNTLGWYYSTLYASKIREIEGEFGFLCITGDTGSGKSATNEVLSEMWGKDRNPTSADLSKFAQEKLFSSSRDLPIWIDEYKTREIDQYKIDKLKTLIREATRGGQITKGNADQSVTVYDIESPLVITGEQKIDSSAEKRRQIPLVYTKVRDEHREAKKEIDEVDLKEHAKAIYRYAINNKLSKEEWQKAKSSVKDILYSRDIQIKDLELNTVVQIWGGLAIYQKISKEYDADIDLTRERKKEAILEVAEKKGDQNRVSHFDEFIKLLYKLKDKNKLDEYDDYKIDDDEFKIKIKIDNCQHKIKKYLRDHGIEDEYDILNSRDYKRRANNQDIGYVIERSYDRSLNRCTVLDREKILNELIYDGEQEYVDDELAYTPSSTEDRKS
jgi:hypothetical protein